MTDTISAAVLGDSALGRAALGLVVALAVTLAARAVRALSWSGVVAAVLCGTACSAAGSAWASVLIAYFMVASLVSRLGQARKERLTHSVVAKGGARDAMQVLANGGVYSAAAVATITSPGPWWASLWAWGALSALAVSAGDTWATEIGVLAGWAPISILERTYVKPGMSGGVTLPGSVGALGGAASVALLGAAAGFSRGATLAALIVGWAGAMVDSLLGATIQQRRRCDRCGEDTELLVHPCGALTRHIAGLRWVNNDVINFLATLAGFFLSAALYLLVAPFTWSTGVQ